MLPLLELSQLGIPEKMGLGALVSQVMERFDQAKNTLDETLSFYKELQEESLPESIKDVAAVSGNLIEKFIPSVSEEALKKLHQRALSIEDANRILTDFENCAIQSLTVSTASIVFQEMHKTLKSFFWLIGHAGELVLAVGSAVAYALGYYGSDAKMYLKKLASAVYDLLFSDEEGEAMIGAENIDDSLKNLSAIAKDIAEFIIGTVVLGVVVDTVLKALNGFTVLKFSNSVRPLLDCYSNAMTEISSALLPQKSGRKDRVRLSKKN
jgi:hypothetical protein